MSRALDKLVICQELLTNSKFVKSSSSGIRSRRNTGGTLPSSGRECTHARQMGFEPEDGPSRDRISKELGRLTDCKTGFRSLSNTQTKTKGYPLLFRPLGKFDLREVFVAGNRWQYVQEKTPTLDSRLWIHLGPLRDCISKECRRRVIP